MLMPAAMIMANRAMTQEIQSARPDAPIRDDRPARRLPRLPRLRAAIARAVTPHKPRLRGTTARAIKPEEPHRRGAIKPEEPHRRGAITPDEPRLRRAIAGAIKRDEPRRAARTPRDILDATRSVIAGWHG